MLVEFALALPFFLLIMVAAVDLGRAFHIKNVLEQAAREGARLRAVSADTVAVRERVLNVVSAAEVSVAGLVIEGPLPDESVHVAVTGEFTWLFPGVFRLLGAEFTNPATLTADSYMRDQGSS